METALRPYAIHRDEGEKLSFVGALTWIKATGAQTGGAFGLIEQLMPPGRESPWHLHHNEDESFYVIEGEVLFIIGDEQQRIARTARCWRASFLGRKTRKTLFRLAWRQRRRAQLQVWTQLGRLSCGHARIAGAGHNSLGRSTNA